MSLNFSIVNLPRLIMNDGDNAKTLNVVSQCCSDGGSQFAVPMLMFTNNCSLTKNKNKIRALK